MTNEYMTTIINMLPASLQPTSFRTKIKLFARSSVEIGGDVLCEMGPPVRNVIRKGFCKFFSDNPGKKVGTVLKLAVTAQGIWTAGVLITDSIKLVSINQLAQKELICKQMINNNLKGTFFLDELARSFVTDMPIKNFDAWFLVAIIGPSLLTNTCKSVSAGIGHIIGKRSRYTIDDTCTFEYGPTRLDWYVTTIKTLLDKIPSYVAFLYVSTVMFTTNLTNIASIFFNSNSVNAKQALDAIKNANLQLMAVTGISLGIYALYKLSSWFVRTLREE